MKVMKKVFLFLLVFLFSCELFAQEKIVGGYFTNWSIYSRKFGVFDLPSDKVNQITQAFMFPFVVNGTLHVGDEVVYRGTSKTAVILTCTNFTDDNGIVRTTGVGSTDFYADIESTLGSINRYGTPIYLTGNSIADKISSWSALPDNSKPGVLGQMVMAKTNGIEIIASLGGWTLAQHFPDIAKDIKTRTAFAQAVATFASQFKFDGIDFDWEFPVSGGTDGTETLGFLSVPSQPHYTEDPMNMVMLCEAVKTALPIGVKLSIATNQNPKTVASMYIFPNNKATWAGKTNNGYDGTNLDDWVDRFYTMTYDYGGSWLSKTSHQAPLYNSGNVNDPDNDMSASAFINKLVDELGVPAGKVMMGVPFYGRGWGEVAAGPNGNGLYQASGQGSSLLQGSWDDTPGENSAAFDFGDLKDGKARNLHQYIKDGVGTGNNGFIEYWDDVCKVPYLYNASTRDFISYDNKRSIEEKTKFAMSKGLAGVFTWEFSQDDRALTLVSAMADNAKLYNVSVSGTVKGASGSGISGVSVNLSVGDTKSVTTGSDGAYSFTVAALKDYTVSFSKSGYTFLPTQKAMTMLAKDSVINVIGSTSFYSISGKIVTSGGTAIEGVELELKSGTKSIATKTSGADGAYTFTTIPGDFDYQIIPHSPYYTLQPASLSYTALAANKTNQDLTAALATYSISGIVKDKSGNPVSGATVSLSGGTNTSIVTASDGTYSITGLTAKSDYQVQMIIDKIYYSALSVPKTSLAKNETVNFSEYPGIAVFGFVKDGATPQSGATVAMTNDWQTNWAYNHSATTDNLGFYSFVLPEAVSSVTNLTLKPSSGTWYASPDIPATLTSSLRADFNTQKVAIALAMVNPSAATVFTDANGKVQLEATASVGSGSISSVKFEIDGQVLTAVNTTGTTYQAEWTPSSVFTDYTIKVTATTSTDAQTSISKSVYVDCNTNCPNKKPVINLVSPMAGFETQSNFTPFNISVDVTDADGTIGSVIFKIDGSTVTPVKSGTTYSYSFTPASYKTYAIEISATDNGGGTTVLDKNYTIKQPSTFTPLPDVAIVGYWHNWASAQAPFIPLASLVNSKYTVIDVSFAEQKSNDEDYIATFAPDATGYPNVQTFKDDIQLLKKAGKVVLLSLGGENGHFSLESATEKNAFVASLKTLVDTYGFDGIDIDFEGSAAKLGETSTSLEYSTLTSARSKYLIDALKELVAYYGDDFVLTFAPELYYVQVGVSSYPGVASGDFLPVLYNLRNEMDLLHVQYYNYGSEWWMGASKQAPYSAELVTQELELLLTGFPLGSTGNTFPAIAPSKLAIGLPCTCSAAGQAGVDDYNVPIDKMIAGLEYLRTGVKPAGFAYTTKGTYAPIRGMMTWSINWDATTDCSHTPYDFANRYYAYFDGLNNASPVVAVTSPANNASFATGTVPLTASASDADGSVAKVDFYVNSVKVGTSSASPHTFNWTATTAGAYTIYAIAADNLGKTGKSAEITVQAIVAGSPVITLDAPVDGAQIMAGDALALKAIATDSDGTIANVEFFDGTTKLGEDAASPFEFAWSGATPGVHSLTAKATDNDGKTTTTGKISITVNTYFTLSGTVKRENGTAISGVVLSLVGNSTIKYAQTDAAGYYTFTNVMSFKDYILQPSTSSASVFNPTELSVTNLSANQSSLNFVLNEGVFVHGYIKNGTVPVSGAKIQVILNYTGGTAPWASNAVTANADGYYKFMIPDAYIGGAGGTVKMNAWDNSQTTYYPATGYTFTSFSKVERCDFNAQQNDITISILTATLLDATMGNAVLLQASADIVSGNISSVTFSVDNQVLTGSLVGTTWQANWTSSALDADYSLSVNAIGEGISRTATKSIRVNCSGSGCSNKIPLISFVSPTTSVAQQLVFVPVTVSASVTDPDGTVSSVKILVDGAAQAVSSSGNTYSCNFTPAAYKKYILEVQATDNSGGVASLSRDYTVQAPTAFTPIPEWVVVGYHHTTFSNGTYGNQTLADLLNSKFNSINCSFIETTSGYIPKFEVTTSAQGVGPYNNNDAQLKTDIVALKAAGKPVLVSIGGANGHIELTTDAQRETFVAGIISIVEQYGFDGIDIDFEGGTMAYSFPTTTWNIANVTDKRLSNIILAIRAIHDYFGNGFIITAAPETQYVQGATSAYTTGWGSFLFVIQNIKDILSYIHVQLYNTGSQSAIDGKSYTQATPNFVVAMTEMLLHGFNTTTGLHFDALEQQQVAIGLPSCPAAAPAGGYMAPAKVYEALDYLTKGTTNADITYSMIGGPYPNLRGMMTWSTNWDASNSFEFANKYYDYHYGTTVDATKPVIASFVAPQGSLTASVPLVITATDNVGVTGYYLVADNNTAPTASATGWTTSKPTSFTLASEGMHTLYLWVKDAAGNISTVASASVFYDGSVPVISEFSCPEKTTTASVNLTITATDNLGVSGYYLAINNATAPASGASGWTTGKPASVTLTSMGSYSLYLWVKDAAGNISAIATAPVVYDKTAPVATISCPAASTIAKVPVTISTTETGSGVAGYFLKADNSDVPALGATGWVTTKPTDITLSAEGAHTLYLWVKDAAGNISIMVSSSVNYSIRHFVPVWTGNGYQHMEVMFNSIKINDLDLQSGDEVGIFDGSLCVGSTVLTGPVSSQNTLDVSVSMDDGTSNGYTSGNPIAYRVYIKSSGDEINVCSSVYDGSNSGWVTDGKFKVGGTAVVSLSCSNIKTQIIPVVKNWNIISANLSPGIGASDISTLFQSSVTAKTLIKIMDQSGHSFEDWGVFGGWKNKIGNWTVGQGYHVKAASDFNQVITGTPVVLPFDIALKQGWNIISYLGTTGQSASDVFRQLIQTGMLRKVMSANGKTLEDWGSSYGGWKNSIGNLEPNQGYLVYVYSDCILTIAKEGLKSTQITQEFARGSFFQPVYEGNGYFHMTINVEDMKTTGLYAGDEIGVFDGDMCVGSVKLQQSDLIFNTLSIVCSCDDGLSASPNGFGIGHTLNVKVYHSGNASQPAIQYLKGNSVFDQGGSTFISFNIDRTTGVDAPLPQNIEANIFPNPFSDLVEIEVNMGGIKSLKVEIFDVAGTKVRSLYSGIPEFSFMTLQWDGTNDQHQPVFSGIYLCRINDQVFKLVRK